MAIDTRNKRASCLSLGLAIARVLANPDASLANVNDRAHLTYLYSGIDVGAADTYAITGIHLYLAMRQQLDLNTPMRQQLDLEAEMRQELNNTGVYLGGEDN